MSVFESGYKDKPAVVGRQKLRTRSKTCFPMYLLPFFTQE